MKITKKQLKRIIKEELQQERKGLFLSSLEETLMETVKKEFASYNWPPEQWGQLKVDLQANRLDLTKQVLDLIGHREMYEVRSERHPQGQKIATAKGGMKPYEQGYEAGTRGDRSEMPLEKYGTPFYDAWMSGWDDGLAQFHR